MFSLNVRKSKMLKKCNNFFRRTFSFIKVSLWASRRQYCLPRSKLLSNSQNSLALKIRHWWKKLKLKLFSFFPLNVPLDTWKCSLSTPSSFSWRMAEVYLCQMSESQRRSCNFFEKEMSNWSYGQVERSFDTIAGKNDIRSKIFAPCLKLILKSTFFSKNFFFLKGNVYLST